LSFHPIGLAYQKRKTYFLTCAAWIQSKGIHLMAVADLETCVRVNKPRWYMAADSGILGRPSDVAVAQEELSKSPPEGQSALVVNIRS
jgi:hypothetical protein